MVTTFRCYRTKIVDMKLFPVLLCKDMLLLLIFKVKYAEQVIHIMLLFNYALLSI